MGEVYKARDTRLHRLAAIKVLSQDKMSGPDRRGRFVLEAQAASALNHPHIITIYAIDHDAESGIDYIAMEFVQGRTLEQSIGRRGLKLQDTLRIGIQIADALAAAHAAGIVHRDLKPGNVMLADNGSVKVLDFGLAKLTEPADDPANETTRTIWGEASPTEKGTILGTVSYMSPEQAEGKAVDSRSDIFSYGSLLYEMATGRCAFRRQSKMSTLSAILREEPKPAGEAIPRDLEKIIARCLRKDVARRFQHIDDVKIALEELKEESESGQLTTAGPVEMRRSRVPRWAVVVAAMVGMVAVVFYYRKWQAAPVVKYRMVRLTSDSGLSFYPALSPDGTLLAFASDRSGEGNLDIWVKQIAGGEPIRLTHDPANHSEPAFSPDGASIVFRWEQQGGGLYVMPTLGGGDARRIADGGHNPRFSPDGKWVAYWLQGGPAVEVFLVPAMGGPPRRVAPELSYAQLPFWAGDSTHILLSGRRAVDPGAPGSAMDGDDWYVAVAGLRDDRLEQIRIADALQKIGLSAVPADFAGGARSAPVITGASEGRPRVVLSLGAGDTANLWEIPLSPKTWQPTGAPERLTFSAGTEAFPAVATGGRIAFANVSRNMDLWEVSLPTGKLMTASQPARLAASAATNSWPTLSADGKKLGFLSNRSGKIEIWVKDLETGRERPLTNDGGTKYRPLIAQDGSSITYYTPNGLQSVALAGGQPETLCARCGAPLGWSPNGSLLLYINENRAIGLLNAKNGNNREILHHSKYALHAARFSPDGRWLSFQAGTGINTRRIYVAPFRDGPPIPEAEWIPITDGTGLDREPRWSPDGNLLYFLSARDGHNCIWSQRLDSGKHSSGEPSAVAHMHAARRNLDVNDTGQIGLSIAPGRLVFAMAEAIGNIWMLQ
jgi:Tol biopolymer transport system component/tRNA A-37 threonylcarbamoyl transferase component Bud32